MEPLAFNVPGKPIEDTTYASQKNQILIRTRELCGWKRATFPGSQPVSLSSTNIGELGRGPYVACEKTDGVRYLLLAASGKVFLVDRKETGEDNNYCFAKLHPVRVLEMCLPLPQDALKAHVNSESAVIATHQVTLLDGELVQDEMADGTKKVSFLIYDAVCVEREVSLAKMNLMERLKAALLQVVRPREEYEHKFPARVQLELTTNNHMPIYLKDFYEIWDIMAIRNYSSKRLPHLSDGIIFTPVALPYIPGTCKSLMKWKPPELNTVDFAAELLYGYDPADRKVPVAAKLLIGHRGFRAESGCWVAIGEGSFWPTMLERERTDEDCDGAIWECFFDPKAKTIIPHAATSNAEQDRFRLSLNSWQGFWRQHPGMKRALDEEPCEESRKRKKLKLVKQALDSLADNTSHEEVVRNDFQHPKIGRLPVTHLPKFPTDVCPIVTDNSGSVYYDYTNAEVVDGGWVLERIRTDKLTPNDERVMQRVKESIDAGINYVHLFNTLLSYRKAGLKPVHAHCKMPEYFAAHGTRTQVESMELYEQQAAAAQAVISAALAKIQADAGYLTRQQPRSKAEPSPVAPDVEQAMWDGLVEAPSLLMDSPPTPLPAADQDLDSSNSSSSRSRKSSYSSSDD